MAADTPHTLSDSTRQDSNRVLDHGLDHVGCCHSRNAGPAEEVESAQNVSVGKCLAEFCFFFTPLFLGLPRLN